MLAVTLPVPFDWKLNADDWLPDRIMVEGESVPLLAISLSKGVIGLKGSLNL